MVRILRISEASVGLASRKPLPDEGRGVPIQSGPRKRVSSDCLLALRSCAVVWGVGNVEMGAVAVWLC